MAATACRISEDHAEETDNEHHRFFSEARARDLRKIAARLARRVGAIVPRGTR